MDKKTFSEVQERLLEVNKVITKLDLSIRAVAFDFLKPYISSGKLAAHSEFQRQTEDDTPPSDVADLIQKHGDGKPHENANLLAAIWFSEHGSHPFSLDYIRERATSTGVTIPAHIGMTFRQAKEKGKKLYESMGRGGRFKPTVVGEAFFKTAYKVRRRRRLRNDPRRIPTSR